MPPLQKVATKRLVSARDVAELMGCTPETVHDHCRRGLLPAPTVIRGRKYWPRPSIEKWIDSGCKPK